MKGSKRPWYEVTTDFKFPKRKVTHRATPDSYNTHRIAMEVFATQVSGQDVGIQASFACEDMYKIVLAPGSHVMLSPATEASLDLALIVALKYRGIGKHPVFVVTTSSRSEFALKDHLRTLGIAVASDCSGCDKGAVILRDDDAATTQLRDFIKQNDVLDAVLVFDHGVRKATRELLVDGDLKSVRAMISLSSDHVSEIDWHKRMKFPHKAYFVSCAKMLNTQHAVLTMVDEDTVAHRGTKPEIESSLRWIWSSETKKKKCDVSRSTRTQACRAWIKNIKEKMDDESCAICLGNGASSRVIMSCCAASYCSECVFKWANMVGTCPNCRDDANINTMHLIADEKVVVV